MSDWPRELEGHRVIAAFKDGLLAPEQSKPDMTVLVLDRGQDQPGRYVVYSVDYERDWETIGELNVTDEEDDRRYETDDLHLALHQGLVHALMVFEDEP